jgi:hypothetical protein
MKKRNIILIALAIAAFTWLYSELFGYQRKVDAQIFAIEKQIEAIRKHDISQDKWIGDIAVIANKPAPVAEVKTPEIDLPTVPIPFYVGAVETLKRLILR